MKNLFLFILLVGCSAGQTDSGSVDVKKATAEETVLDSSQATVLAIEAGSLKNAKVTLPADSVASGSSVTAKKGTAPTGFTTNSNVSTASEPMVVSGTDSSGNALSESSSPMTLQIPISALTLSAYLNNLFAVEKIDANLCILLSDVDSNLFVWRREKIALLSQVAYLSSKKFGTYQAAYCGTETIESFTDTAESAPSEKSQESESTTTETASSSSGSSGESSGSTNTPSTNPVTFTDVNNIIKATCATNVCHGNGSFFTDYEDDEAKLQASKSVLLTKVTVDKSMPPSPPAGSQSHPGLRAITEAERETFKSYLNSL